MNASASSISGSDSFDMIMYSLSKLPLVGVLSNMATVIQVYKRSFNVGPIMGPRLQPHEKTSQSAISPKATRASAWLLCDERFLKGARCPYDANLLSCEQTMHLTSLDAAALGAAVQQRQH